MDVTGSEAMQLVLLIGQTFRVHPNSDPVYVDVGTSLPRLSIAQHQIVFGRRGSGKSCLLVHYQNINKKNSKDILVKYINCDANKRGKFPDLLTSLLISIFSGLPGGSRKGLKKLLPKRRAEKVVDSMNVLLHSASSSAIEKTTGNSKSTNVGTKGIPQVPVSLSMSEQSSATSRENFTREKLEELQRNIDSYREAIDEAVSPNGKRRVVILLDDFYLIDRKVQPDVVDYIHRLLRGTNVYFKIGTIRHRTSLRRYEDQTIGVELGQDVQVINLDRTLSEFDDTKSYLEQMINALGNWGQSRLSRSAFQKSAHRPLFWECCFSTMKARKATASSSVANAMPMGMWWTPVAATSWALTLLKKWGLS